MKFLNNLEFFFVEAFRGIKRSGLMSIVAIGIVTVSLFIFGLFLIFIANLGHIVSNVGARLDMVAYVNKNLSSDNAASLQLSISKISGIEEVRYISKEEAWKNFKEDFGGRLNLDELVRDNPLPNTYAIKVRTPDLLPHVAEEVAKYSEIEEVRYSGKLIKQIQTLIEAVRIGGAGLMVLLFAATLLIVVNTIRLTVLARATDIYIMKLVGATESFVRWPFVIEGIIIGILGGGIGVFVLKSLYETIAYRIQAALPFLPLIYSGGVLVSIYIGVFASGLILGMLGGYISVSRLIKDKE
ncbi:ABC transporter permease [Candidatus Saganbacteria bacterium]|nr:ABC transporter permease [Candidatus Saganbacteria bacterium]